MYAEYDSIGLFKQNSCFRVNIQTFSKIGVLKMYPRFKMLIFRYKTRFFNEIFDIPRVLLGAEHESAVISCPRPRDYGQKWIQRTDLLWDFAYKEQT